MMSIRRLPKSLYSCVFFICLGSVSINAHSEGFDYHSGSSYWGGNDEDTILVEDETDFKVSYSKAIKSAFKSFIGFDIDHYFSGGQNKRSAVIRQLNDIAERSHYRFRLNDNEVSFRYTLNL